MKLKTAYRTQVAFGVFLLAVKTPLYIVFAPFVLIAMAFDKIKEWLEWAYWSVGNRLLKSSDEAKDGGIIKNKSMIRRYTAADAYLILHKNKLL